MNTQNTSETALDEFTMAYIMAALWTFDEDAPSGEYETSGRFETLFPIMDRETVLKMAADCAKFQIENSRLLGVGISRNAEKGGHDFWLSRNGHGSGFFDSDYWALDTRDALQAAAEKWGPFDLYYGDDNKIYGSPL